MDGIIIIDKPAGPTSHDCVQIVRRIARVKKAGHLGTLDPQATGVLPVVLGSAAKFAARLAGREKSYEFTLVLGIATATDDDMGEVIRTGVLPEDLHKSLWEILPRFIGRVGQRPPIYSAVNVNGKRAYEMARDKLNPELKVRDVTIENIKILDYKPPLVRLHVDCHSGTYIRSLARDMGEALRCFGHAKAIRRLRSGRYLIEEAVKLEKLMEHPELLKKKLIPMQKLLDN